MSLSAAVKRAREERGMSDAEIVKAITSGWPPARIEVYKAEMAKALGITEVEVVKHAGPRPTPKIVSG